MVASGIPLEAAHSVLLPISTVVLPTTTVDLKSDIEQRRLEHQRAANGTCRTPQDSSTLGPAPQTRVPRHSNKFEDSLRDIKYNFGFYKAETFSGMLLLQPTIIFYTGRMVCAL